MSEAKHTPGPWAWSDSANPADAADWTVPGTDRIRTFGDGFATRTAQLYAPGSHTAVLTASERDTGDGYPDGLIPDPADMALIAAAPDLLALCKWADAALQAYIPAENFDGHAAEFFRRLAEAIKKAEGAA